MPAVLPSKNMLFEADKVMFEIYRETEYTGKYRVCYFTELQDHNKESEINHALAGEHFFDGFIKNFRKDEAKEIIASLLGRLNNGEQRGRPGSRARARRPHGVRRMLAHHALSQHQRDAVFRLRLRVCRFAFRRTECGHDVPAAPGGQPAKGRRSPMR